MVLGVLIKVSCGELVLNWSFGYIGFVRVKIIFFFIGWNVVIVILLIEMR